MSDKIEKNMRYYLDTEFIEGFKKPLFGKRRHFIDLISIGIVCEDGREYYAVSNEFDEDDADEWVKKNVIAKLPTEYVKPRKSEQQIKAELLEFFGYKPEFTDYGSDMITKDKNIEIYAYYADYDWVLFCSIFGRMIDLPNGMPMYCRDLKQLLDERELKKDWTEKNCPQSDNEHDALDDAKWNKRLHDVIMKTK